MFSYKVAVDQQDPHFIISSWTDKPHSLSLSSCTLCSSPAQLAALFWASLTAEICAWNREPQIGHSTQIWCQTEGKAPFPGAAPLLIQHMVGHLGCKGSLAIMLSLLNTRMSRTSSSEPLFSRSAPACVVLPVPCPVQNLTFAYAHFHEVFVCSSLKGKDPFKPGTLPHPPVPMVG